LRVESCFGGALMQTQLTVPDDAYDADFGGSVAISGDYAIVGSYFDQGTGSTGAAYVFHLGASGWTLEATLGPSGAGTHFGDHFGSAVALRGDMALVSAFANNELGSVAGKVYAYRRSGTNWALEAELLAESAMDGAALGVRVALADSHAVAGALDGQAFLFEQDGGSWNESRIAGVFEGGDVTVGASATQAIAGATSWGNPTAGVVCVEEL